jgi:hypothetical protein
MSIDDFNNLTNMTHLMNFSLITSDANIIEEMQKISNFTAPISTVISTRLINAQLTTTESVDTVHCISDEFILNVANNITPEEVTSDEDDENYDEHEPLLNKVHQLKINKQKLKDEIKLVKEKKKQQKKQAQERVTRKVEFEYIKDNQERKI